MTEHEKEIEQVLLKFRPASPPEGLRARVLTAVTIPPTPVRNWRVWVFRAAVAAMLIFAFSLNIATAEMTENLVANIGIGPAIWTEDAEEFAKVMDGNGWGRQYIALGLMTRPSFGHFPAQPPTIPGEF